MDVRQRAGERDRGESEHFDTEEEIGRGTREKEWEKN